MAKIITITKENFEQEIQNSGKTVLLDFWASWCGPCKMITPILTQVAAEIGDDVIIGKINVDEQLELASAFQVSSIPTLITIKGKTVFERMVGFKPKNDLINMIQRVK